VNALGAAGVNYLSAEMNRSELYLSRLVRRGRRQNDHAGLQSAKRLVMTKQEAPAKPP
jgi:hypothetical protein